MYWEKIEKQRTQTCQQRLNDIDKNVNNTMLTQCAIYTSL